MRLLECESKEILKKYGIPLPKGMVFLSADDVTIKKPSVLKAQIPLGGRGKAGGILEADSAEDAKAKAAKLLSTQLRGYTPKKILIEEKVIIAHEYFMAVTYDTVAKEPVAVFSCEGGVDIEELAAREPGKVRKELFTIQGRLPEHRAREIISETGVGGKQLMSMSGILSRLADIFLDCDATLAEINPMAETADGQFIALDCHIDLDDEALFRHKDFAAVGKDQSRFTAARTTTDFERRAAEIDALDHRGVAGRFIEFDGNLGVLIGGGGASLTAFDAIRAHGGKPANYCEIGGNPSVLKVKELTKLILEKPHVKKIAVIMNVVSNTRVDLVARGIVKGILEMGRNPSETVAVFRIPGAWEEEGDKILAKYGIKHCDRRVSIDEAAKIAVENSFSY